MTKAFRLGQIEAALAALFPPGVVTAVEAVAGARTDRLWPAEAAAIAGAVPARQAEFAAGRAAARRCLAALGKDAAALPVGHDRAPVWPDGLFGSISHAAGVAVAAVSPTRVPGLDVEEDAALEAELWPLILTVAERARLPSDQPGRAARRIFAAKEAVFKAQRPGARAMFGFDAVEIDVAGSLFTARFQTSVGAFARGQTLSGRIATVSGLILAGVTA